ncbi:MAG TPA: hypothetical protein PKM88_15705 [bacterium]|nr:hypothetical protein [bacterium]
MAHSVPAAPAAPPPGRRYTLLPLTLLAKGRITRGAVLRIMVIMLLFLVMGAVLIITTTLLERMSQDVHRNSMALNLAHELEITVLAHRRNSLLFLAYNDSAYLVANNQLLVQADQLIPALAAASVPTKASA